MTKPPDFPHRALGFSFFKMYKAALLIATGRQWLSGGTHPELSDVLLTCWYLSRVLGIHSARAEGGSGQGRLTLAHRLRSDGREPAQGFG